MSRRREEQGSPLTMEAISDLLDKKLATHSQTITTELHRSFAVIETKLDTLQSTVSTNSLKITELESTINNHDQRLEALESTCSALASKNTQLAAQVLDLQSRSRRNTIRVLGLPEGVEGAQPVAFFGRMLEEMFRDVLGGVPEIERAHRSLGPKPAPHQRPRPVLIRLLRFQEKDRIIREARAKRGQLRYGSHPVLIFEDYPPEIVEQRKKYSEVMATLYKLGCKPALHFPARLTVRLNGVEGRKSLSSVQDANIFISSLPKASPPDN
ncbi:hypothetical protein AAFF_G00168310 [Aldrovandia affinis]|uniref:LINE-1 type transposase domain-containing 1 n=1 Tax=Aldrovandia affinis TaxID=143900 RepID=A0AAD7RLX3_9TELE|nr:hypothetical protein AAFF_G00168310 [Aldrovandia affinis]